MITYHKYTRGEDLFSISMHYRIPPCIILRLNNLSSLDGLDDGTYIKVPAWWLEPDTTENLCAPCDTHCVLSSSPKPTPQTETYTVQENDTLFSIARRYRTTMRAIMHANSKDSPAIYDGEELTIPLPPPNSIVYTVKPRETLSDIASSFNTDVAALAECNGLDVTAQLYPGMQVIVPSAEASPSAEANRE